MICLFCDFKVKANFYHYEEHVVNYHAVIRQQDLLLTLCLLNDLEREEVIEQYEDRFEAFKSKGKPLQVKAKQNEKPIVREEIPNAVVEDQGQPVDNPNHIEEVKDKGIEGEPLNNQENEQDLEIAMDVETPTSDDIWDTMDCEAVNEPQNAVDDDDDQSESDTQTEEEQTTAIVEETATEDITLIKELEVVGQTMLDYAVTESLMESDRVSEATMPNLQNQLIIEAIENLTAVAENEAPMPLLQNQTKISVDIEPEAKECSNEDESPVADTATLDKRESEKTPYSSENVEESEEAGLGKESENIDESQAEDSESQGESQTSETERMIKSMSPQKCQINGVSEHIEESVPDESGITPNPEQSMIIEEESRTSEETGREDISENALLSLSETLSEKVLEYESELEALSDKSKAIEESVPESQFASEENLKGTLETELESELEALSKVSIEIEQESEQLSSSTSEDIAEETSTSGDDVVNIIENDKPNSPAVVELDQSSLEDIQNYLDFENSDEEEDDQERVESIDMDFNDEDLHDVKEEPIDQEQDVEMINTESKDLAPFPALFVKHEPRDSEIELLDEFAATGHHDESANTQIVEEQENLSKDCGDKLEDISNLGLDEDDTPIAIETIKEETNSDASEKMDEGCPEQTFSPPEKNLEYSSIERETQKETESLTSGHHQDNSKPKDLMEEVCADNTLTHSEQISSDNEVKRKESLELNEHSSFEDLLVQTNDLQKEITMNMDISVSIKPKNNLRNLLYKMICPFCGDQFSGKGELSEHCLEAHNKKHERVGENKMKCMYCEEIVDFDQRRSYVFTNHENRHIDCECVLCYTRAKYPVYFHHERRFHTLAEKKLFYSGEPTVFQCKVCLKPLINENCMEIHTKKLHEENNFVVSSSSNPPGPRTVNNVNDNNDPVSAYAPAGLQRTNPLKEEESREKKSKGHRKKCYFCSELFYDPTVLKEHCLDVHNKQHENVGNNLRKCMVCSEQISLGDKGKNFNNHILVKHRKYECGLCFAILMSFSKRDHEKKHHEEKELRQFESGKKSSEECKLCQKKLLNINCLKIHMKLVHGSSDEKPLEKKREEPTKDKQALNPFCNLCFVHFPMQSILEEHRERIHFTLAERALFDVAEVKPSLLNFSCYMKCNRKFINLISLKYHMKHGHDSSDDKIKPAQRQAKTNKVSEISCEYCGKGYPRKYTGNLNTHVRNVHKVADYRYSDKNKSSGLSPNSTVNNFMNMLGNLK